MRTRYKVLIGAVLLTIIAFFALLLNTPQTVTVPDVTGQTLEVAKEKIEVAGLKVGNITEEESTTVEEGAVIRTNPGANTSKREGSSVDIVVATEALVSVPDVTGKSSAEAQQALEAVGFSVKVTEEYSEKLEEGLVIRTDPVANTSKAKGSTITLYVSRGGEPVTVPDVSGKTLETATAELKAAGFIIGATTEEYSSTIASGSVISTDPVATTSLTKGSVINLIVSKGEALTMPDFGKLKVSYAEARRQLQVLGVSVSIIERQEDSNYITTPGDLVVSQYPLAGQAIEDTVTLNVSVAGTSSSTGTTETNGQ